MDVAGSTSFAALDGVNSHIKLFVLRVTANAGCSTAAASIVNSMREEDIALLSEDIRLVISVWQSVVTPLRVGIQRVRETGGPHCEVAVRPLCDELRERLSSAIETITAILGGELGRDTRALLIKTIADFQRYKLETIEAGEVPALANESRQNYLRVLEVLGSPTPENVEIMASTQLNHAILLAEYLRQRGRAIALLAENHNKLSASLGKYSDQIRDAVTEIIGVMGETLEKYKALEVSGEREIQREDH
jgi:hypothetical protein